MVLRDSVSVLSVYAQKMTSFCGHPRVRAFRCPGVCNQHSYQYRTGYIGTGTLRQLVKQLRFGLSFIEVMVNPSTDKYVLDCG